MARIKSYDRFLEEFTFSSPKPETDTETTPTIPRPRTRPGVAPTEIPSEEDAPLATKPGTGTETAPTIPRPRTRPGVAPTEIPSEEDAPLASAQKVIDRLGRIYQNSTKKDKQEIDSYFQK